MNIAVIALDALLMVGGTALLMVILGALSERFLGARMSAGRILLAGALGLGAGLGFESQFVWRSADYTPALIPVLIGIILLVSVAVLVIAELLVPRGTLPRPNLWPRLIRQAFERQLRYVQLLRIIAKHRLFLIRLTPNQSPAVLREQALDLKRALEEAGGAFVKLGQLLSTRADVVPPQFIAVLGDLQQDVPPAPWAEIEPELERALHGHPGEVFAEFSETPFAAASIGQVHAAVLHSGEHVAVKIRRPGIVPLMERDIDIAQRLARSFTRSNTWAEHFGVEELVDSLAASLRDELDYTQEATNITALTEVQKMLPADARVRIPRYYDEYSNDQVLVMEFLTGETLAGAHLDAIPHETRTALARRLLAATLAQIMDAGVFHADLHPGNIIICSSGELALLDFGSIGRLDSETRTRLGQVLLAVSRRDATAFADALFTFVDLSNVDDETGLRRDIASFMARRLGPGSRVDMSMFNDVVAVLAKYGLQSPPELTVPFRTIATVQGSLELLDPSFDFVAEVDHYATEKVRESKRPASIAHALNDEFLSVLPIVKRLPHRLDRLSGNLADGRFGMNIRMFADPRDRSFLRGLIDLAVITFLAGVFGVMAAMLLSSATGPRLTDTLTLFQMFGYLFMLVSGMLTLRALFDVLRRRSGRSR